MHQLAMVHGMPPTKFLFLLRIGMRRDSCRIIRLPAPFNTPSFVGQVLLPTKLWLRRVGYAAVSFA